MYTNYKEMADQVADSMRLVMESHIAKIQAQADQLVIDHLTRKGFEHIVSGIKTRRFPKIQVEVSHDGWNFVWADDDSETGRFIIAYKIEFAPPSESPGGSFLQTANLIWQDTYPGVITIR